MVILIICLCFLLNTIKTSDAVLYKTYLSLYLKGFERVTKVLLWEGVGDQTELQHIDPHSYGHNSVSFPFSWAAQPGSWGPSIFSPTDWGSELQLLNRRPGGPASLGAGSLYRILFPTCWTSSAPTYIIVRAHLLLVGVTNHTHSTRPRSRLYSEIPRLDAPVIYTGAFPILTARPSGRSIYNTWFDGNTIKFAWLDGSTNNLYG